MITVNSNGNPISASFITALTSTNRTYDAKLLVNGTELDCSISQLVITKGSCGAENFTIGNIVGSTLTADVKGLSTTVKGSDIEVRIGVEVNGSYEYVTLGYFTVSEAPQNVYATTITAYGATVTRTGDSFTVPETQTLANIATSISTSVSALAGRTVSVTFDSGITTSDVVTASLNNLTVYQALQVLASVVGGYAIDTYDGNIKICRFSDTPTLTRDNDTMRILPVVEEDDFEVNGVLCVVTPESEDDEGHVVPAVQFPTTPTGNENLVVQNQYMTQALYSSHLATLAGYEYRPATIGLTYGDPRLEGDDVVQVTDINSNVYIVPCHMITHTYTGGFSSQVVSATATPQENDVATSAGSLTETLSGISQSAISARTSAESAKAEAQRAYDYAEEAKVVTDEIVAYAETAEKTVTQILEDGETAHISAEEAKRDAGIAYNSATQAIDQLSVVEDIVGVLDLLSKNGVYEYTQDIEPLQDKWYFTYDSVENTYVVVPIPLPQDYVHTQDTGVVEGKTYYIVRGIAVETVGSENPQEERWYVLDDGVYVLTTDTTVVSGTTYYTLIASEVENPVDADIGTYYEYTDSPVLHKYYELTSVDESVQNYVSSHLALVGNSLYLQNGDTRVELSTTTGLTLYNESGDAVANYGAETVIGDINTFGIKIGESPDSSPLYELGFYQDGERVAYINNKSLYITQTVVLSQMQLGDSFGLWAWSIHQTSLNGTMKNNLYLKWLG